MTPAGRMTWIPHEPCSISADTVVALLERIGWHEAADLINRINERDAAEYREADRWRKAWQELKDKYEPDHSRVNAGCVSAKPDWTCDG